MNARISAVIKKMKKAALFAVFVVCSGVAYAQPANSPAATESQSIEKWPPCFFQADTNSSVPSESLGSHLHYDKRISPECLNLVADFLGRSRDRIQERLTTMPPELKTNYNELLSLTNALHGIWGLFLEIAARPEMDQNLFTKCRTQAETDQKKSPGGLGVAMLSALARNPATPADFLKELSESDSYNILLNLVCNPSLATNLLCEILEKSKRIVAEQVSLPEDKRSWWVINNLNDIIRRAKITLASNPTTAKELLSDLAKDSDRQIRAAVGRNTNAPIQLLKSLLNDSEGEVRAAAAFGLARSPNTPGDLLDDLAAHSLDYVCAAIARNPVTPRPTVEKLLTNEHYEVWTSAFRVLAAQQPPPKELLIRWWQKAAPFQKRVILREAGLPDWFQAEMSARP